MARLKETQSGRILESKTDASGKISYPVVIISQGLGNLADKNYYSKEAILSAPPVYEGKKVYFDHPTQSQSQEQPGRSVRETCGHYENCKAVQGKDGIWELRADLVPEKGSAVIPKIEHAIEYKKKFPDQDYIGISINGDGEGEQMEYAEFLKECKPSSIEMEKISKVEGQPVNVIKKLTAAVSADLVTEPGAKGRFLQESEKVNKKQRRSKMFEAVRKFLLGAEKNDKTMLEAAVKDMLQSEGDEEMKKKEAAEDAAMSQEAETMVKAMLNAKKENKKYEDESESEYEARCMKQAMKQMKKEAAEAQEKEAAEAAEKAKSEKEGDEEKKESADKKDGEEKKEAAAGDEKHDDEKQDIALIKKMMTQMGEMKAEIESLKKEKKESEEQAKKHHESATKAEIVLAAKEQAEAIDRELAKSGLPRSATDKLRELFADKFKSKEERKKVIETMKEAHSKAVESLLFTGTSTGFVEITSDSTTGSTDHLF